MGAGGRRGAAVHQKAFDLGFTFFDTADVYSNGVSEEITGRALKDFGPARDSYVLATKVYGAMGESPNQAGLSRKHIMAAIDASLTRLGMDYVDLYQIHRFDPLTPMEETLEALTDVVKAGKALYIGASSMYAWQFAQMLAISDRLGFSRFVTMQNHYNLLYREEEREMIPLCRKEGVGLIPWSPLARGLLTRSNADMDATLRAKTDRLRQGALRSRRGRPCDHRRGRRRSPRSAACPMRRWRWPGCCRGRASPRRSSAPAR